MARRPFIADRRSAMLLGMVAYGVAAIVFWDAFEGRGRHRPFWTRFVGAAV
jgi:hypothetical protein